MRYYDANKIDAAQEKIDEYANVWTNSEGADRLLLWFIDENGDDKADTLYLNREYDEWYKAEQGY